MVDNITLLFNVVYVNENARGEFPISSTQKHVVKKTQKQEQLV
jgi:hypothetical protein